MLKNENKQEDMVSIMEHLMGYIPSVTKIATIADPDGNGDITLQSEEFYPVLFGGDQLTAERACSS